MNKIFSFVLNFLFISFVLLLLWQITIEIFKLPPYLLPSVKNVFFALEQNFIFIKQNALISLNEIISGLILGIFIGIFCSLVLFYFKFLAKFFLPIIILSQAIPVFAIAPLLVLWFGFGFSSKIIMTILIVFFPVTSATYDGLKNTPKEYIYLAKSYHASKLCILLKVRLPLAFKSIFSGIRIASCVAPIGAIIGEWVGSAGGLGYLMIQANARMQTDLMFASLFVLMLISISLYYLVDFLLKKLSFNTKEIS